MLLNRISFDLSDELYNQLAQAIRDLDTLVPFAVNLTVDERSRLPKMGDKSIAFVEKAAQFTQERPDLVPNYLDTDGLQKKLKLSRRLKDLLNIINPVVEKISDSYMAAGIDAFSAARDFYDYVKAAAKAGAPGSDSIAWELKKRYGMRVKQDKKENVETNNGNGNGKK